MWKMHNNTKKIIEWNLRYFPWKFLTSSSPMRWKVWLFPQFQQPRGPLSTCFLFANWQWFLASVAEEISLLNKFIKSSHFCILYACGQTGDRDPKVLLWFTGWEENGRERNGWEGLHCRLVGNIIVDFTNKKLAQL